MPLYDYWREPGGAYLVFRLMRGGTAENSLVTGGRWSLERVGRLVEQVGNAMVTAHAAGIAHRDIRAANILLDDADNMFVSDFGIATEPAAHAEGLDMLGDVARLGDDDLGIDRRIPAGGLAVECVDAHSLRWYPIFQFLPVDMLARAVSPATR